MFFIHFKPSIKNKNKTNVFFIMTWNKFTCNTTRVIFDSGNTCNISYVKCEKRVAGCPCLVTLLKFCFAQKALITSQSHIFHPTEVYIYVMLASDLNGKKSVGYQSSGLSQKSCGVSESKRVAG